MASAYWIKLYHEVLDDPKMGQLPDHIWRRAVELFLMAGERDANGELPPTNDIAWRLRCATAELEKELGALEAVGIVSENGTGWFVTNFSKRQAPISSAERQRRYRERRRANDAANNTGVTERNVTRNGDSNDTMRLDIDTDKKRKDSTVEAEAASPESYAIPLNLDGWIILLREPPPGTNRTALLRAMGETLYPAREPPPFSRFGQAAKKVGGAERLAQLMWQSQTYRVTGNYLDYCTKMASGKGGTPSTPQRGASSTTGWSPKPPLVDDRTPEEIEELAQRILAEKRQRREAQPAVNA